MFSLGACGVQLCNFQISRVDQLRGNLNGLAHPSSNVVCVGDEPGVINGCFNEAAMCVGSSRASPWNNGEAVCLLHTFFHSRSIFFQKEGTSRFASPVCKKGLLGFRFQKMN